MAVGQPDSTAVTVAPWQAAHRVPDYPPYVIDDDLGRQRAYPADEVIEVSAELGTDGRWPASSRHLIIAMVA